jgi:hypothetical protein
MKSDGVKCHSSELLSCRPDKGHAGALPLPLERSHASQTFRANQSGNTGFLEPSVEDEGITGRELSSKYSATEETATDRIFCSKLE